MAKQPSLALAFGFQTYGLFIFSCLKTRLVQVSVLPCTHNAVIFGSSLDYSSLCPVHHQVHSRFPEILRKKYELSNDNGPCAFTQLNCTFHLT